MPLTEGELAQIAAMVFPPGPEMSCLLVEVSPDDYLASVIARAVEDCDAHLLNLNVLEGMGEDGGRRVVVLRIDRRNAPAVARSLERYGMSVLAMGGADKGDYADGEADLYEEVARSRVNDLLRRLSV